MTLQFALERGDLMQGQQLLDPDVAAITSAGSSFEALFVRALKLDPELERALREAGFDARAIQAS